MRLKERVALLTNCGTPVGQGIARALVKEGAHISMCGPTKSTFRLKGIAQEVEELGGKFLVQELDLTNSLEIQNSVEATRKLFGKIDILVNTVAEAAEIGRFIEEVSPPDWDQAMNLTLKSTFLFCQAVGKVMKEQRGGKMVILSSRGARTAEELSDFAGVTAQAGIFGLTRQFAHQLGPFGINVNAIAAGIVSPGWRWEREWQALGEEKREALIKQIPLRRFGRPEEVARVVVFLASDDSSYISGATIDVNGGQLRPLLPPRTEKL